ncbi:MAG: hypothetical protein K2K57_08845 [Oscillospiraceae bacterium]|nr:hypothetical protein [Oscillospiraceae bacterium]
MKIKKKAAVAAAVFAAAMNFSACAYGPPPESDFPDHSSGEVYSTPAAESNDFDPVDNVNYDVYGPPEEEWEDEMTEESVADESSDMTVDTNENSEVNADE